MLTLNMDLKNETKSCYRFETKVGDDLMTLYLKKSQVKDAKIDPAKGIAVNIEERK